MDIRHLKYFVAVAEELSFVRAAERLHISQPPLSMQIKDLEDELGTPLFNRSNKGVELTAAGSAFYSEARAIVARVENARLIAQRAGKGESGRLAIGFVSIADYSALPAILRAFTEKFPAVELELIEETTDAQIKALTAERLDIGVALAPVEHASLVSELLLTERLMLALPERYGDPSREWSLRELADQPFISFERQFAPGLYDAIAAYCRGAGFTPRVVQRAKQMQTIVSLVSAGLGVALIPESLRHLQRTGVVYVTPREPSPVIEIVLTYRKSPDNPAVAHFVEVARRAVAALRTR